MRAGPAASIDMRVPGVSRDLEPMSKVDTAWLRMERPTNLMMVTGVLMLDAALDVARFKKVISQRFLAHRRFRQRAVDTAAGAFWQSDPDFDLDWHVRLTALPGEAGELELQNLVSLLASTPLDHSKPLWQFHVVERYRGGSAVIMRIHHCYADGIALIQVLLSMTDTEANPGRSDESAASWLGEDGGTVTQRLRDPVRAGVDAVTHLGGKVVEKGLALLKDPAVAGLLAREGAAIARELAIALALPDDPVTPLRGSLGVIKRCAWAEPLRLDEVKTVARALECTVNDVLLSAACGALRSYLADLGHPIDGLSIRATVPVNLRPLEHAKKLGNRFGLVFLELPIGESNPLRRLELLARNMQALKRSRQAIMAYGLLAALGMGPAALQGPALELFSRKATAVATNVPGPQMPLYFAGRRIVEQMFWVPQTGSIGVGISILSYDGQVHFGLIADAQLVPEPRAVIERFAPEFEKLLLITLMEDWGTRITAGDAAATLGHWFESATPSARLRVRAKTRMAFPGDRDAVVGETVEKNQPVPAPTKTARARRPLTSAKLPDARPAVDGFSARMKAFRRGRRQGGG
jgi:WS/DGAT/MGAT family acyltransferase